MCEAVDYERMCPAQPLNEYQAEVRSLASRRPACKWDHTEVILLAGSFLDKRPLIKEWILSWVKFMECFPALHVVSNAPEQEEDFRGLFQAVPNVTLHTLQYPFPMETSYAVQWPLMWADNFTTARHVLILGANSPLIRPTRCHQLFNEHGVPVWHSVRSTGPWVECTDALVQGVIRFRSAHSQTVPEVGLRRLAWRGGVDLVKFFPVVIPRAALPATRQLISEACASGVLDGPEAPGHPYGRRFLGIQNGSALRVQGECGDFDRAFMALLRPNYVDLMGKAALFLTPSHAAPLIKWQPCDERARTGGRAWACIDYVPVTADVDSAQKGMKLFAPGLETQEAAAVIKRRVAEGLTFAQSGGGNLSLLLESFLFYNHRNRSEVRVLEIAHSLLRADDDGEFCGIPQHAAAPGGIIKRRAKHARKTHNNTHARAPAAEGDITKRRATHARKTHNNTHARAHFLERMLAPSLSILE